MAYKEKKNTAKDTWKLYRLYYISKNICTVYYKGYKAKRIVYVTRNCLIKWSYSSAFGENTFDQWIFSVLWSQKNK